MMIKIYRDGLLTPLIGELRPGRITQLFFCESVFFRILGVP